MPAHRTGVGKTNPAHNDVEKATLKEGSKIPGFGRYGIGWPMLPLLLLSADCTETNSRKCGRWRLVHHYRHSLLSLWLGQLHWGSFWYSDNHHIIRLCPMAVRHALPMGITFPGRTIHQR
ncbi:unnamed protein product [Fusarium venenatum]|uniref:Uncharacterized protein n=1 Tax=Fusarium venenatum TaxID=56646 RepID=A0A2L2U3Q6_9HYPO|nr:uncharacterized protein FVRRES_09572 [Fusarium venenatum]CEI69495.1 unnamed protein product [Fusarium venenatum]